MKLVEDVSCKKDTEMNLYFCSRLETDKRLFFGGFPSVDQLQQLKENGFKYIVDCTTPQEKTKLKTYNSKDFGMVYITFPIVDNFIPTEMESFNEFLGWISYLIQHMEKDEYMYIHCKGGHGRSGLVSACVLCYLYGQSPHQGIQEVSKAHTERRMLSPRWKNKLCPSNEIQRVFVKNLFRSCVVSKWNRAINNIRHRALTKN